MNLKTPRTALLAVLLVLTACGSGGATSQSSSSTTTTSTTAPTTAPPTTTTTAAYGAPLKTVTFDITTKDGYKAVVRVRWHQETTISDSGLFKSCRELMFGTRKNVDTSKLVMVAVVAEITAQFPQIAGSPGQRTSRSASPTATARKPSTGTAPTRAST